MRRLSSFPPLGVPKLSWRKSGRETHEPRSDITTDHDNCCFKPSWKNFTLSELQKATNNFRPGSKEKLNWDVRYKIAVGTATGLEYLHERCQKRIIHRDIKAANVLLTDDYEPQVLKLLQGKQMQSESTKVIRKPLIRRTYSEELFDAEEYNATRYLNDLTRHKKLALDF
ncbi:hypothetical protein COCNU_01G002820 [Cocos nucifera]|uniref:Protein kinase domain-containing protein n=1 Tax=Cocos nucifera TaxID=13894 RepID=A0A8K0HU23_COCNU|nr:hypothetical protein COCNU_01G002820 [Cocos nucifera]